MSTGPAPAVLTTRTVSLDLDHDQALLLLDAVRCWNITVNCLTKKTSASGDRDALRALQSTTEELRRLLCSTVLGGGGTVVFDVQTFRLARAALAAHQEGVFSALRLATPTGSPALGNFLVIARRLDHLLTETLADALGN